MRTVFWEELSMAVFRESFPAPNISHEGCLPGPLPVSELLAETIGLAGVALARLCGKPADRVDVDGRLCAFWASTSCQPIGWEPPEPWDPLSAVFKGTDGWIRLHANAPRHKAAAVRVLGGVDAPEAVAEVISGQAVGLLEEKIIAENGAAARMIPWKLWREHPQGRVIARTPLVEWTEKPAMAPNRFPRADFGSHRPLSGIKVLDLTRVLAGPVATRALAGFGASVLRIDPTDWDDPGLLQDTTVGKRCAGLDLKGSADRSRFEALLRETDLLVQSYRPGALERLGYDRATLDRINPACIDVSLSAYGRQGPWGARRGFDSLVQFSTGIADICGDANGNPGKLPVQALDHAAGYIMAAIICEALRRSREGQVFSARISLAGVSFLLCNAMNAPRVPSELLPLDEIDFEETVEYSDWGKLKRLRPRSRYRTYPSIGTSRQVIYGGTDRNGESQDAAGRFGARPGAS